MKRLGLYILTPLKEVAGSVQVCPSPPSLMQVCLKDSQQSPLNCYVRALILLNTK